MLGPSEFFEAPISVRLVELVMGLIRLMIEVLHGLMHPDSRIYDSMYRVLQDVYQQPSGCVLRLAMHTWCGFEGSISSGSNMVFIGALVIEGLLE